MKNALAKIIGMILLSGLVMLSCDNVTDSQISDELVTSEFDEQFSPFAIPANADVLWYQDFSEDTDGWLDFRGTITHNAGAETATVKGDPWECPGFVQDRGIEPCYGGAFSQFDGYRDDWPGDYIAELDIYLDPDANDFLDDRWGFDYIVASNRTDGNHLRDFVFHVGFSEGALLVNGSNNSDLYTNEFKLLNENNGEYYTISEAGWYTFQHSVYDDGGYLAVDLNLFNDNGDLLWTATRNTQDEIATDVGGNRYSWFTHVDAENGIEINNHALYQTVDEPTAIEDCKDGGWEAFGFRNQGQCIRYVNTGKDSR